MSLSICTPYWLWWSGLEVLLQGREGYHCCFLGKEIRYTCNYSSCNLRPSWHTPRTEPIEMQFLFAKWNGDSAIPKRQWFFLWHVQPALTLAAGMGTYPKSGDRSSFFMVTSTAGIELRSLSLRTVFYPRCWKLNSRVFLLDFACQCQ